jgi:hypothetical protein
MRLNIASGMAVRFEPGQQRTVELVEIGGDRQIYGFRGLVQGPLPADCQGLTCHADAVCFCFCAGPGVQRCARRGVCRDRAPRCARRLSPGAGGAAGFLVGDARALLGLAGIGLVMQVDALRWPIGLAGAAYLLWLSWDSWQAARTEHRLDAPATAAATQKQALRRGMALSLTNPQNLAYWAAMGSALGAVGVTHPAPAITGCSSRDS